MSVGSYCWTFRLALVPFYYCLLVGWLAIFIDCFVDHHWNILSVIDYLVKHIKPQPQCHESISYHKKSSFFLILAYSKKKEETVLCRGQIRHCTSTCHMGILLLKWNFPTAIYALLMSNHVFPNHFCSQTVISTNNYHNTIYDWRIMRDCIYWIMYVIEVPVRYI